jgi:type VI secretion system protein ImpK
MDVVNQITAECFNALSQLRELEGPGVAPEAIHDRLSGYVEAARERARELGLAQRDADDIAYALVALIDEVAMGKPEPLRSYWMTQALQLRLFNENLAGEGFFTRLQELRRDQRRTDVLRVYYLCLLLGFQGKYAVRGGDLELMRLIDSLRPEIERQVEAPDPLAPAGLAPDTAELQRGRRNPLLWVALGVCALAIAVFIGLRVSLDKSVGDLSDRVEELNK